MIRKQEKYVQVEKNIALGKNGEYIPKSLDSRLKIAVLCFNLPLHGYPPSPTLHPYISACGVDKKTI